MLSLLLVALVCLGLSSSHFGSGGIVAMLLPRRYLLCRLPPRRLLQLPLNLVLVML